MPLVPVGAPVPLPLLGDTPWHTAWHSAVHHMFPRCGPHFARSPVQYCTVFCSTARVMEYRCLLLLLLLLPLAESCRVLNHVLVGILVGWLASFVAAQRSVFIPLPGRLTVRLPHLTDDLFTSGRLLACPSKGLPACAVSQRFNKVNDDDGLPRFYFL